MYKKYSKIKEKREKKRKENQNRTTTDWKINPSFQQINCTATPYVNLVCIIYVPNTWNLTPCTKIEILNLAGIDVYVNVTVSKIQKEFLYTLQT